MSLPPEPPPAAAPESSESPTGFATGFAPTTERTRVRVHPERTAPDEIGAILREGLIANVAIADEEGPVVIPMTYAVHDSRPRTIYIHGAHHSRLMKHLATGRAICISVTMVDGLVYSRTALNHSVNYRSAVCFGHGRVVKDREEQLLASYALIERYFPGRTEGVDYAPIPEAHLKGTSYVAIDVTDASAKVRRGGPKGPGDDDPTAPGTAGVIEFSPPR